MQCDVLQCDGWMLDAYVLSSPGRYISRGGPVPVVDPTMRWWWWIGEVHCSYLSPLASPRGWIAARRHHKFNHAQSSAESASVNHGRWPATGRSGYSWSPAEPPPCPTVRALRRSTVSDRPGSPRITLSDRPGTPRAHRVRPPGHSLRVHRVRPSGHSAGPPILAGCSAGLSPPGAARATSNSSGDIHDNSARLRSVSRTFAFMSRQKKNWIVLISNDLGAVYAENAEPSEFTYSSHHLALN